MQTLLERKNKLISTLGTNMTIRRKLLFFVFCGIIIPFVILFLYIIGNVSFILEDNSYKTCQSELAAVGVNIIRLSEDMTKAAKYISFDKTVQEFLKDNPVNGEVTVEHSNQIDKMLVNLQSQYLDHYFHILIISDGVLRTSSGITSVSREGRRDYPFPQNYLNNIKYLSALERPGVNVWNILPLEDSTAQGAAYAENQVALSTAIVDYSNLNTLGVVIIEMSGEQFRNKVFENHKVGDFDCTTLVYDQNGSLIVISTDEASEKYTKYDVDFEQIKGSNRPYTAEIGGEKYLISGYLVPTLEWQLVQFVPYKQVLAHVHELTLDIMIISLVVFACLIFFILRFSRYLTNPLMQITREMNEMRKGNYYANISPSKDTCKEIVIMEETFNNLVSTQRELLETLAKKERNLIENQKRENALKMEMLLSQINPHFLFNTLNTIKWTALMSNAENVAYMLSHLGNILEMTFRIKTDFISLEKEIKVVESFFFIYSMRTTSQIKLQCDIPEKFKDCKVPKFIIQPLVENSVMHAFPGRDCGDIAIAAQHSDDGLLITVKDNGIGMSPQVIEQLKEGINTVSDKNSFSGIGICNVHERIRLLCGEQYGLSFSQIETGGTCFAVRLPLIRYDYDTTNKDINC